MPLHLPGNGAMKKSTLLRSLVVALVAAVVCPNYAPAAVRNADVDRAVSRGLDWLANHQSRLGHWTAQQRPISDAP